MCLAVLESATEAFAWQSALGRWAVWVLVCGAGGVLSTGFVGLWVNYVLPTILALDNGLLWFGALAFGVGVAAALFALPQWVVVRRQVTRGIRWVSTTAWSGVFGAVCAFISFFPIVGILGLVLAPLDWLVKVMHVNPNLPLPDWVLYVVPGGIAGLIVGVSQARTLAPTIKCPARWVLASTLGAAALVAGAGMELGLNVINPTLDRLVVGSVAYGMTTGIAVAGLFGHGQSHREVTASSGA